MSANLTDCDELDAAWTDCDFDDSAIAEIDAQLKARILESTLFSAFLHGNCTRTLTFENFGKVREMTSSEGGHVDVVVALFFLWFFSASWVLQRAIRGHLKAHILKRILYSGFM